MRYLKFMIMVFAVVLSGAAIGPPTGRRPMDEGLGYIKSQTIIFSNTVHQLKLTIDHINPYDRRSIQPAITALQSCRIQYKKISFFLDYFFPQQGKLFNAPAKPEVEEPYLEIEDPQSLQQIESILFSPNPQLNKNALQNLILVLDESAAGLNSLYSGFHATRAQMLESLHLELIRIMTLYITGYDAPDLKTGVRESYTALESMLMISNLFFDQSKPETIRLDSLLSCSIRFTRKTDFEHFDRLVFLQRYALPLEEQLNQSIRKNDWQLSTIPSLNYNAKNLFQCELNSSNHPSPDTIVELGRELFFEKTLSGNNKRSCASCHQPDKYFSDGLIANQKIKGEALLRRNTPTLLYAACQSAQFWDGRAASLSEQIADVVKNPDEMNASFPEIEKKLDLNIKYRNAFHKPVNKDQIVAALIAFLKTLQPMNSAFDRFMAGNEQALSASQKKGFNLFMGKAQCGTCHFAPVFNGSTPPFFNRSDYEVLGVPGIYQSGVFTTDIDLGRYECYPISVYLRAFKTPTVRNVAMTGPYMHNGRFKTLREVIAFYNKGGGAGIGLGRPEQTLSGKPLHLSKNEISDIVAFLDALTDHLKLSTFIIESSASIPCR